VIKYSNSSVAATLHSSGGSLHLRYCSKPSSQLPGRFQLSQNDVLWGGFWAWEIKRNCTEPSQGCMVGEEALWYYFEPKIPSQRLMCDLAHCRGEGTTCLQFNGRRAQLCFSNAWVPVGKMFDSQSVQVAQTPCEQLPLSQKKMMSMDFILDLLTPVFFGRGDWELCYTELCLLVVGLYSKTQVLSPVVTLCRKSGSLITRSKSSRETNTRF